MENNSTEENDYYETVNDEMEMQNFTFPENVSLMMDSTEPKLCNFDGIQVNVKLLKLYTVSIWH